MPGSLLWSPFESVESFPQISVGFCIRLQMAYDACTLSIHLSLWVLNQSKVYYTKILLTARPGVANYFHHGMQGVIQTTSINTKGQIVCNSAYVTKTLPHKMYCITHEICSCYFQFLDIYWTFLPPAISFCRMVFYVFWGIAYIDT